MNIKINIHTNRPDKSMFTAWDSAFNYNELYQKVEIYLSQGLKIYVYKLNEEDCEYADGVRYYMFKKLIAN
jgi:hypothetical protein